MMLSKAETPGDFAVLTRLVDFTLNDEPGPPSIPARCCRAIRDRHFDVTGSMRWLVDMMSPAETEAMAPRRCPPRSTRWT